MSDDKSVPKPEDYEVRMRLSDEECARIDARVADPSYRPAEVQWLAEHWLHAIA